VRFEEASSRSRTHAKSVSETVKLERGNSLYLGLNTTSRDVSFGREQRLIVLKIQSVYPFGTDQARREILQTNRLLVYFEDSVGVPFWNRPRREIL
jgi:hypothetical protein